MDIKEKILKGIPLTEHEVRNIIWEKIPCVYYIDEISESPERWHYRIDFIFSIDDNNYSVFYYKGNTECQENEYPSQIARKVIKKQVVKYEWVYDDNV